MVKQATFMLSHAFVALGIMSSPLAPYVSSKPRRCVDFTSISPEWMSWCKRWYETSTLRQSFHPRHTAKGTPVLQSATPRR